MKIKINTDICSGCNMCHDLSNGVIRADKSENGKAEVQNVSINDPELAEGIELAAQACPMQAITVEK